MHPIEDNNQIAFQQLPSEMQLEIIHKLDTTDCLIFARVSRIAEFLSRRVIAEKMVSLTKKAISEITKEMRSESGNLLAKIPIILAKVGLFKEAYETITSLVKEDYKLCHHVAWDVTKEEIRQGKIFEVRKRASQWGYCPINLMLYFIKVANFQSEIKDFKGAEETLNLIEQDKDSLDDYSNMNIAPAWAKAGNFTNALAAIDLIRNSREKCEALAEVAVEKSKVGDNSYFALALEEWKKIKSIDEKQSSLKHLIQQLIQAGSLEEANEHLNLFPCYSQDNEIALSDLCYAFIQKRDWYRAKLTYDRIKFLPSQGELKKLLSPLEEPKKIPIWPTNHLMVEKDKEAFEKFLKEEEANIYKAYPQQFNEGKRNFARAEVARIYLREGYLEEGLKVVDLVESPARKTIIRAILLVESLQFFVTGEKNKIYIRDY